MLIAYREMGLELKINIDRGSFNKLIQFTINLIWSPREEKVVNSEQDNTLTQGTHPLEDSQLIENFGYVHVFMPFFSQKFLKAKLPPADAIIGLYWSPNKDAKIEIYKTDGKYYGKSTWVATPRKDINNPNEALRKREVLGIELLTGFSYEDGVYVDGKIYDPENGKSYTCKMILTGTVLKVRGYIGISLFGRTVLFNRIR